MTEIKAQEYLKNNWTDQNIKEISLNSNEQKLTQELIIQDYPNLAEITLRNHELTALMINNCPNLKRVNVFHNQLTKLELNAPNLEELIGGQNELTTLDLANCQKVKKLIVPDNPYLAEIKNLNWTELKNISIINTLVNLNQNFEELKQENKGLMEIVKQVKEGAEEKGLVITEAIQTSKQSEEAIYRLLVKIEKKWREYFAHPENALPSFQVPENKSKIQQTLIWIIEAKNSGDYQKLAHRWNNSGDYNAEYDFDGGSLDRLMQLLRTRNYFREKEQAKPLLASNLEHYDRK